MAEKKKGFVLADALAGVSNLDTAVPGREQIEYIDPAYIKPDERNFYALDGIKELAANIEFAGLQQPIRLRPDPDAEGSYVILSGHRRFAALEQLRKEDPQRWALYPCIVERESAGGEAAAALQELKLIYANSDTRKMSSADLAKQAERVEMLLYELKEAGVEFPGRMRDHVAEACKVSKSKLARLKVIRENLDGEIKKQWEAGKLNESEAYNLAKLAPEHRAVIWAKKGNNSWNYAGAQAVEQYGKRLRKVDKSAAPDAIPDICPVGCCANLEQRREASLTDSIYWDSRCEQCCHGCPDIGTCKYACPGLADEIEKAKQAKKAERKAQKERVAEVNRPTIELLTQLWRRFGALLSVGGMDLEELKRKCAVWRTPIDNQKFMALANGEKAPTVSDPTPLGWYVGKDGIKVLLDLANALGCSVDYLLCRTDEPQPAVPVSETVISFEKPQWNTGKPGVIGSYYCQVNIGSDQEKKLLNDAFWWDGKSWLFKRDGADINSPVVSWWPLPDAEA